MRHEEKLTASDELAHSDRIERFVVSAEREERIAVGRMVSDAVGHQPNASTDYFRWWCQQSLQTKQAKRGDKSNSARLLS